MSRKIYLKEFELYNTNQKTHSLSLKINELVDAVNELQEMYKSCDNQIGILAERIAKLQHGDSEKANCQKNVDPYAEQRKWIGKLCRFWDNNYKDHIYRILNYIEPDCVYLYKTLGGAYMHCEPVSPEDDIIYKKD